GGGADDGVAARARAALAGVGLRAGVAVVAGRAVGLKKVGRAGGVRAGAELRRVTLVSRWATLGRRRLEGVGGAVVTRAIAGLGEGAVARRRAAHGARGLLRIIRAHRAPARAGLGHVAGAGFGAALRPGIARRVLAGVAAPVALIERAGVAVVGARRPARLLLIARAGLAGQPRAHLRHVALARRRAADEGA